MILSIIVAIAKNNCIGKENKLLWQMPADLKHFREITSLHPIIMGRKTFESIGRPLPNRRNIVITRDKNYLRNSVDVAHSLEEALFSARQDLAEEIFVIGGAEIYKQALPLANKLYITKIDQDFDGDAFFPEIDEKIWRETARETHKPNEKNLYKYTFLTYEKI